MAACACSAAATASPARANAAWNPSPVALTTYPPLASIAARNRASCSATSAPHLVGPVLPQPRRTLDVGEQERHRPRRRLPHERDGTGASARRR